MEKLLQNTPFQHPCNVYKESKIPILKDYNVSDECKEIGKHLLDMTKNPLCQHVDVLIPNEPSQQTDHFKHFFGKKYMPREQQQESNAHQHSVPYSTNNNNNSISHTTQNACIVESPTSKPIKEFIATEQSYVNLLEEIVYKIMKPIKESIVDPNKQPILDQYSFNRIFINMEDILHVNKSLLESLLEYKQGSTVASFGSIISRHFASFDCYKIFFLGKSNSLACHQQNIKQNKNYAKFLLNKKLKGNLGMNDILIQPIQRMGRYNLLLNLTMEHLDPHDMDQQHLMQANAKVSSINDMQYGDSSLLNLYHLIRDAPASLIQTRQLLGYFDATELSLQSGKSNRPVTLLVFTDKIMVVKRKNYNMQGKDYLEKIEEKVKDTHTSSMLQKAKEAYNGLPLEFKGWADMRSVEIFDGLKDRPDTFFLRTCLPDLSPNATEKECEAYFRRSDRLYSIIPSSTRSSKSIQDYIASKSTLIRLCQEQCALSHIKDTESNELYYEDKFKLPAYTQIYNDQESYRAAEYKNHILVVYLQDGWIDINRLIDDDVWVLALVHRHESGGYRLTIHARTSLIPIREKSRDIEYEQIVVGEGHVKQSNTLDFIDTLWNNLFFYERRLRATDAFSCINDDLLRVRARSRSRSKSLTRVASNMSLGKIFSRSRSSSPSRRYSVDEHHHQHEHDAESAISHVLDPIFKIATVNKQLEDEFRAPSANVYANDGYGMPTPSTTTSTTSTAATERSMKTRGQHPHPARINTAQPHYFNNAPPSEIFVRDDTHFIDGFNQPPKPTKQPQEDVLYSGSNLYQDNSYNRPDPYSRRRSSVQSYNNFDAMLFSQSPQEQISRPSSGGSNKSASSFSSSNETSPVTSGATVTTPTTTDPRYGVGVSPFSSDTNSTTTTSSGNGGGSHPYNTVSSYSSSIRSYLEEGNILAHHPHEHYGSFRSNHSFSSDERLMNAIDGSRRSSAAAAASVANGSYRGKKVGATAAAPPPPPLPKPFYSQPHIPTVHQQQQPHYHHPHRPSQPLPTSHHHYPQQPTLPHRAYTSPAGDPITTNFAQLKLDVNDLIDNLIQSQQAKAKDYNTYESVRGLRSHIVSRLDEFMDDLHPVANESQYDLR
ncbi:hypothetical protein MAM1_0025d02081 [Mucor ambiguus]|uniref:DH domain-containing protein n=1 Tax=Mucor ambiguus TaxID=91626 RepID=A0A0C9M209_9FUNG|nr:hypothetical protein MAM1_0025d02081 [Mucor ambiguus]